MFDITAPEILVIFSNSGRHIVQRQAVLLQPCGVDFDLELLRFSSPTVDVTDPWQSPQLVLDRPVLYIFHLHRIEWTAERVLEKFAEGRSRPAQHRLNTLRQTRCDLLQPFSYKLASLKHRNRIVEDDGHHRQPEF